MHEQKITRSLDCEKIERQKVQCKIFHRGGSFNFLLLGDKCELSQFSTLDCVGSTENLSTKTQYS